MKFREVNLFNFQQFVFLIDSNVFVFPVLDCVDWVPAREGEVPAAAFIADFTEKVNLCTYCINKVHMLYSALMAR